MTAARPNTTSASPAVNVTATRPTSDVHMLVNASFRFLLSNEPKESILGHFALSDIERYFPSYANAVAARLGE